MWRQVLADSESADQRMGWVATRPEILGLLISALCLGAYLAGGAIWLLTAALTAPAILMFLTRFLTGPKVRANQTDGLTGLMSADVLARRGQKWLKETSENKRKFACFEIAIDGFAAFVDHHGEAAAQRVQRTLASRILRGLREDDLLTRRSDGHFMFLLTPVRHLDLEICAQLASRLKSAIEAPLPIDATTLRVTASIGFCRNDQIEGADFQDMAKASQIAMRNAQSNGPSTIRAFSDKMRALEKSRDKLCAEATQALQLGQIQAWFQPQVATATGEITGFEALARWNHPERGIVSPAGFMDVLANAGQLEQLADVMLTKSLQAQKEWQRQGHIIPHVGVNFAGEELRNPLLVEKIHWELDRFDLAPDRISIEVLETVIADAADGAISRNVNGLANLGCYIDLDDFGTGHASISSIRRFAVSRLKIDRSFVTQVDQDPEQQKLVSAIVTMADRLGLETLAEGVETSAEQTMLSELGCAHVQGYGIARPMPFEQTIPWIVKHKANQVAHAPIALNRDHGT